MNSYILDSTCGNCNKTEPSSCFACYKAMQGKESRLRLLRNQSGEVFHGTVIPSKEQEVFV